ncbi:hydroxyethylthiazole kinase [Natrarchaeobaculum aegyptiacum]|uniref:Hydroxyethylthiazole kinase n=1 Tax=Natrarchaeobaculum aegyptiacum TaxID=745377 RepID=A0A2Z2HR66_9EURY|nr:hydroxyethylthiazole kinase [Natrarchaeobaculum aegyptiacum]ARS89636.1 hydroxyethylthiazole kinase [Natrarchaeobaculum aegyptiacum]
MSDASLELTADGLATALGRIASDPPLVQALTNTVTISEVANIILHWDALPVMADTPGDAGEMGAAADAVLFNTGQVPENRVEAMLEVGQVASERGIPIVLDPVGVGSTPTRQTVAERLLSELEFAAIKGNYGEISALAGVEADVRGVESVGEYDEIEATARSLADSTGAVVVASGVEDIVATGDAAHRLSVGHERLGEVVGTGCMLGGTVAAFCGALEDDHAAALQATLTFGIAGERAAEMDHSGPGTYRAAFEDAVAGFGPDAAGELEGEIEKRVDRLE